MNYIVGIIDDDSAKITQLLTYVELGWNDENGKLLNGNYKDYQLKPVEIALEKDIDKMVEKICKSNVNVLIVDFKLSSQKNISYSGVDLAQRIDKKLRDFPVFILTSYQDDIYRLECFDAYRIFDFERYISDTKERLEINSKMVQQIKKYTRTIDQWKRELAELLPRAGETSEIDERILQLDSLIENSIDGVSALSPKLKQDLCNTDHIQTLINKIDEIISKG